MLQGIMKGENEIWRRKAHTKKCFNSKKKKKQIVSKNKNDRKKCNYLFE